MFYSVSYVSVKIGIEDFRRFVSEGKIVEGFASDYGIHHDGALCINPIEGHDSKEEALGDIAGKKTEFEWLPDKKQVLMKEYYVEELEWTDPEETCLRSDVICHSTIDPESYKELLDK